MTFYNIIFGILFLAALREVLQAFFDRDRDRFWMSAVLTLLICNDILYTSHCIEEKKLAYTISMKLADLLNFVLLSSGILMLSPNGNLLGVQALAAGSGGASRSLREREGWFWLLICSYWLLCMFWNALGGAYASDHDIWRRSVPFLFFVPLAAMLGLAWRGPQGRLARWFRPIVALLTVSYLLGFKAPEISGIKAESASVESAGAAAAPAAAVRR